MTEGAAAGTDLVQSSITYALGANVENLTLATAGLTEGQNFQTVLLDGYDPVAHIASPGIVGFPVYKSNEPGQLDAAGIEYEPFAGKPGARGLDTFLRAFEAGILVRAVGDITALVPDAEADVDRTQQHDPGDQNPRRGGGDVLFRHAAGTDRD